MARAGARERSRVEVFRARVDGRRDAVVVAARSARIADEVRALTAAEEPQVRVGGARTEDRVQRRSAYELDDRRRIPATGQRISHAPCVLGARKAHDRREDDPVR